MIDNKIEWLTITLGFSFLIIGWLFYFISSYFWTAFCFGLSSGIFFCLIMLNKILRGKK